MQIFWNYCGNIVRTLLTFFGNIVKILRTVCENIVEMNVSKVEIPLIGTLQILSLLQRFPPDKITTLISRKPKMMKSQVPISFLNMERGPGALLEIFMLRVKTRDGMAS